MLVARALVQQPHAVHRIAYRLRELRLERLRIVGRVGSLRERHDLHVEALPDRELHPAERRLRAGRVGVEAEEQTLREPVQLAQLCSRERRSHRRDDRQEPGLSQREHVGVPLDDNGTIVLRDRLPCAVESVEQVALLEEIALRRVHILRRETVVVVELARLEAAYVAARVGEREEQPALEVIVAAAVRESGCEQVIPRELLLLRTAGKRGAARRIAEPECAAHLFAEPSRLEVRPRERALLAVPQQALVEHGRTLQQVPEPVLAAALALGLGGDLLIFDRHAEALRERLDRTDEVDLLQLLDERDRIAALAAAEAFVRAARRRDGEARRALLVEGTQPLVRPTRLPQT